MARRVTAAKSRRAIHKLGEAGITFTVAGVAVLLAPMVLGASPLAQVAASFGVLGWVLLPVGILLLAAAHGLKRKAPPLAGASDAAAPRRSPARRTAQPAVASPGNTGSDTQARKQADMQADMQALADPLDRQAYARPIADSQAAPARPTQWSAAVFETIEWRRFEAVVERLFQQAGFETRSQSHGADEGVDVWLYSRHQPGQPVSLVQCKHWQGKRVGVDKIRELRGVMAAHQVARGQFATTSTFTADAVAFARDNGIHLLDVEGLLGLIARRSAQEQAELLAVALEGDYWRPTCVNCGVKMVERRPHSGGPAFWGCRAYPRCKTTLPMRRAPPQPG
ncbi:MAG: restriction endonuclease [Aquabacterium sp.]|nr:restriction endonuclease [Aquabacterium sp.]